MKFKMTNRDEHVTAAPSQLERAYTDLFYLVLRYVVLHDDIFNQLFTNNRVVY
jgi:hypothetical protein